jgi:hypothetical protein
MSTVVRKSGKKSADMKVAKPVFITQHEEEETWTVQERDGVAGAGTGIFPMPS